MELRGGRPHRRSGDSRAAAPADAQHLGHPDALPGHPDDQPRRRDRPDATGQQQLLLPGLPAELDRLDPGRVERRRPRVRQEGHRATHQAPGVPAAAVFRRQADPQWRSGPRHRLAQPGRPGDDAGGLGQRVGQVRHGVPQRRRDTRAGPTRPPRGRRLISVVLQRPQQRGGHHNTRW